ncbi:hypothetical protein CCYA_CCYA13G3617 [Cyanidiococcus yangmingshanensis]|nr:hypothetical protein CCYA_CCYA13G3617 [Cyanidiococcus yangmingshanensis]
MPTWRPPAADNRSKRGSTGSTVSQKLLEPRLRSHGNQAKHFGADIEATDGRSACSCEACEGPQMSTLSKLGSSCSVAEGAEARSGCSSSSSLFFEENERLEEETSARTIARATHQSREHGDDRSEFGYGVFRCNRSMYRTALLCDPNPQSSEHNQDNFRHFFRSHRILLYGSDASDAAPSATTEALAAQATSQAGRTEEQLVSRWNTAYAASLNASSGHTRTASSDFSERAEIEAVVASRTHPFSQDFSYSMCMSESSQAPSIEHSQHNAVFFGRIWSVASLGVNEPNEDFWQVERERLFHDFYCKDTHLQPTREACSESRRCFESNPATSKSLSAGSGSIAFAETQSGQTEQEQERDDACCDSDSEDSFTVCLLDGHEGSTCCELLQSILLRSIRQRCSSNGHHSDLFGEIGPSGFCERLSETFEYVDRQLLGLLWDKLEESGDGHFAITGACCITATLTNGGKDLFIASLGDCEAYLGRRSTMTDDPSLDTENAALCASRECFEAVRTCHSHNLRLEANMRQLCEKFPCDPSVVQKIGSNFFVKGKLQVSHAFGNGYLKDERFNEKLYPIFRAKPPFCGKYVSSRPQVRHMSLTERDEFLILGTDGFWEHVEPQTAVALLGHFFAPGSNQTGRRGTSPAVDPRRASEFLMQYLWLRTHSSKSSKPGSAADLGYDSPSGVSSRERMGALRDDTTVFVLFLRPARIADRNAALSYTTSLDHENLCERFGDASADRARVFRDMISAWLNAPE